MAYNKLQLQSLAIEEATPGQNAPTDLIFYIDANTGEVKRTEIQDLQISTQGDVYTVNGQTGNVTITADDLGAVKKAGDIMTGRLTVPEFTVGNGTINTPEGNTFKAEGDRGDIFLQSKTGAIVGLVNDGTALRFLSADGTWGDVYSQNRKPTPAEIGAATVDHNHNTAYAPINHTHKWSDITAGVPDFATRWPTYNEVGLKPSDVPQISQVLTTQDLNTLTVPGFYYQNANGNATPARHYPIAAAGSLLVQKAAGITQTYTTYSPSITRVYVRSWYSNSNTWGNWVELYSTYNKPTAADVGAAPTSHTHTPAQVGLSNYKNTSTARWGGVSIAGNKGGYAGINFEDEDIVFMVNGSVQGFHTDSGWQWYFNKGVLTAGRVPWERVSGGVPATATRWPTWTEVTSKPSTFTPPASTSTVRGGFKHTWNATTKTLNIIPG